MKLFNRTKQKPPQPRPAQKNIDNLAWAAPFFSQESVDLSRTKLGAAIAYTQVHQINICVKILVDALAGLRWEIVNFQGRSQNDEDGVVVASSDDAVPRHALSMAFRDFRVTNGFSFISALMFDRTVYGEFFIEKCTDTGDLFFGYKTLEWLNPLGVNIEWDQTGITWFRYGWDMRYINIPPHKVAYTHTRNPLNDYTGYSRVQAAMAKINIERNMDKFMRDFFQNSAIPALIVQPSDSGGMFSIKDKANLEYQLREQFKGLGNQFRGLVLQRQVQATALESPDLGKQYNLEAGISTQIFEAMGVPQAMAGNTSATPYKDGDETTKRFFFGTVLPEAREAEQFINNMIMPFFDPTGRTLFHFDTSAFDDVTESDKLEADVVNSQLSGGYLSLADAARIQERTVESWMENRYIIEGVPMTPQQIDQLVEAKIAAAQAAAQFAMPGTPSSSVVYLPQLTANDEIKDITRDMRHDDKSTLEADWLALYEGDELFPAESIIQGRMIDELETWARYQINKWGKKNPRLFHTKVLPPYIRHAVIDELEHVGTKHELSDTFTSILEQPAIKSISTYQRRLRALVTGLWGGRLNEVDFMSGMNNLIAQQFRLAFVQNGYGRAGIPESEISAGEMEVLYDLISTEQSNVPGLMLSIQENAKARGGALAPLRARVDRWTSRFIGVSERAYTMAMRDKPLKWIFDPRKEHCRSCQRLNGQVRRASKWAELGIHPRSVELECFGLFCGCRFEETTEPLSRGRIPSY